MKAVILSAGQGKRLLPLTEEQPKCLLPVTSDRSILDWQVQQLAKVGIGEIVVVTGFGAEQVERALDRLQQPGITIRCLYNPFYAVADNLSSVWLARSEMDDDFLLLNGDTLFDTEAVQRLLASPPAAITVSVSRKPRYDDDDMKVRLNGGHLAEIGKAIAPGATHAESIGMILFRGDGPSIFARTVESSMRDPTALRCWYLAVINELAQSIDIATAGVDGDEWCEVDYPVDLGHARRAVARWNYGSADHGVAAVS